MRILLDSTAIIDVLEGNERGAEIKKTIRQASAAATTCLNVYEVKRRLLNKVAVGEAEKIIEELVEFSNVLPITLNAALEAAEIKKNRPALGAVDCNSYAAATAFFS